MRTAVLVKLNYRGKIIDQCQREYHSDDWSNLVSRGWITHVVL